MLFTYVKCVGFSPSRFCPLSCPKTVGEETNLHLDKNAAELLYYYYFLSRVRDNSPLPVIHTYLCVLSYVLPSKQQIVFRVLRILFIFHYCIINQSFSTSEVITRIPLINIVLCVTRKVFSGSEITKKKKKSHIFFILFLVIFTVLNNNIFNTNVN